MEPIDSEVTGRRGPEPVVPARDRSLLKIMVDGCAAPLVLLDRDGLVVRANQACADMLSTRVESLVGRPVWEVFPLVDGPDVTRERWTRLSDGGADVLGGEQLSTDPIGNRRRVAWTYRPVSDDATELCVVGTGVDVTRERLAEAHWRQLAQTDPLTGLANRAAFEEALAEHLDLKSGLGCGVLFCDLDGFKPVNDSYGHAAGDDLLIEIAGRLAGAVRTGDVVARLGGDEFAILLPAVGLLELRALATRLERLVRRPIRLPAGPVTVGVSIGLAVANPGDAPAAAVHEADRQMYGVKARRAARRVLPLR
ncbi:MAG TPA: GGDEF domain-containing protein [Jatrophihabitans sp.]|nr:GGDEF domain-containing protein [Jatrophihabitans sp.]